MAIRFLRGSGHSSSTTVSLGQPYFDYTNNALYIGNNMDSSLAISSLTPVNVPWYQTIYLQESGSSYSYLLGISIFTHTVYETFDSTASSGYLCYDHLYESGPLSGTIIDMEDTDFKGGGSRFYIDTVSRISLYISPSYTYATNRLAYHTPSSTNTYAVSAYRIF